MSDTSTSTSTANTTNRALLRKAVVDAKNGGESWADIANRWGITMKQAYDEYIMYTRERPHLTVEEQRILQLDRLDTLLEALWSRVDGFSPDTDVRALGEILKVLREINQLSADTRSQTAQNLTIINNHQTVVIANYVEAVADTLRQRVSEFIGTVTTAPATTRMIAAGVDDLWDEWLVDATQAPLTTTVPTTDVTVDTAASG